MTSPSHVAAIERLVKVIIIGDPSVGKTSYVLRYVANCSPRDYKMTIGVDFNMKLLQWSEDLTLRIQLWDIGGQDRNHTLLRMYYKGAHACLILFDLTNRESFLNVLKWKKNLDDQIQLPNGEPLPCLLLANKSDLKNPAVTVEEIEEMVKENDFVGWSSVSVKKNSGIPQAMRQLMDEVVHLGFDTESWDGSVEASVVVLKKRNSETNQKDTERGCLC